MKGDKHKVRISFWFATTFILLLIISLIYFNHKKTEPRRNQTNEVELIDRIPSGFSSFGIDISHHQGSIDWKELLEDNHYDTIIDFVYCKTSEGTDYPDKQWKRNRKELKKLHVRHGAYHYFRTSDPKKQAEFFLKQWKPDSGDLPPMLDVEYECMKNPHLIHAMQTWLTIVEEKSGLKPIIYTSLNLFRTKFKNVFQNYKFWVASYGIKPTVIDHDNRIIHWQFSTKGKLPGMKTRVDMNVSKIPIRPLR